MIDKAGAAEAAAEPVASAQTQNAQSENGTPGQPAASTERSKETARASVDRAFAALEQPAADADKRGQGEAKGEQNQGQGTQERPAQEGGATADPPSRFSADAKAAWADVPETVRTETHRAFKELNEGLNRYQAMFEPLKPYHQLAEKFGTTIHDTLERYVALDFALLSKTPEERLSAIERVLDHAGITPGDYAAFIMGRKPEAAGEGGDQTVLRLRQEITDLRNQLGGMSSSLEQRRDDEIASVVDGFAAENPRLKEAGVQAMIIRLLDSKLAEDLKTAFDMAVRLSPEPVKESQAASNAANRKPVPAQTRNGNLSISGAPGSGSNPARRKTPQTARESVDNAFASLGLG